MRETKEQVWFPENYPMTGKLLWASEQFLGDKGQLMKKRVSFLLCILWCLQYQCCAWHSVCVYGAGGVAQGCSGCMVTCHLWDLQSQCLLSLSITFPIVNSQLWKTDKWATSKKVFPPSSSSLGISFCIWTWINMTFPSIACLYNFDLSLT